MALQCNFIASDSLQMQNNFSASYTPKLRNVGNPDQEQAECAYLGSLLIKMD